MKKIKIILKYFLLIFIGLILLDYLAMPFNGESSFTVTTLYYILFLILPLAIFKYFNVKPNNLLLVVTSIIFTLFLSEILLRFYFKYPMTYSEMQWGWYKTMYDSNDNKISFLEKKSGINNSNHLHLLGKSEFRNYETIEFNFKNERTNELGLRGKLPSKNKKTIITLGDSFTESFGAPYDSSYPFILEKFITQIDTNFEIINGGVSGSDPFFEFNLLKKLNEHYSIYGAIFMINTSDVTDVMMRGDLTRFLDDGSIQFRKPPFWEPLYAISYVFRLFIHSIGYNFSLMTKTEEQKGREDAIKSITNLFKSEIIPWVKKENIRLYVVLQPMLSDIKNVSYDYKVLDRNLSSLNMQYFNLNDSLMKHDKPERLFWKIDRHFNSLGYYEIAKYIYNRFFTNSVLNKKEREAVK
ncbi:MAG: hypothetical protein NZM35_08635 [Chitinophagales bacterium]|nr:hypothetical protein [Chitinophagales bacterium]MDW8419026.1 hypothetical protein [Chitinophagales bacterium]